MSQKLDLTQKLNFEEVDLTAPIKVTKEILDELPEQTNGIICGDIIEYDGDIYSYEGRRSILSESLASIALEKSFNVQSVLGTSGTENYKYECFLYTPQYPKYKYRMFFMEHGIANYPVRVVLEEDIAKSISEGHKGYNFTCDTRETFEEFLIKILTCKKVIGVMQELIKINQAKKENIIIESDEEIADSNDNQ